MRLFTQMPVAKLVRRGCATDWALRAIHVQRDLALCTTRFAQSMSALDVFQREFRPDEWTQFTVVHQLRDLLQRRRIGLDDHKCAAQP